MAGRVVPGGVVAAGGRAGRDGGGVVRRRGPAGQRVPGGGVPGPDLPAAPGVRDPDRGAGADQRAAVRGGAGPARVGRDAGRAGPVRPAAGAAGPARPVVPLPPPVPRHAAGRAGPPGTRPDPGPAPPRGHLVPAQRPARRSTGILHRRRRRGQGRWPGRTTGGTGPAAGPGHHSPAVVRMAERPRRNPRAPDGRGAGYPDLRVDGAAGRGRAVGRCSRSLAIRGRDPARRPCHRGMGRAGPGLFVPPRGQPHARRRRGGGAPVRRRGRRNAGTRAVARDRTRPFR